MNWQHAIGIIAILSLLVPVVIIFAFKLYRYSNYLAFLLITFTTIAYSFMKIVPSAFSIDIARATGILNNILDAPLMLCFLMLFSGTPSRLRIMKVILFTFIGFELVVLYYHGYTIKMLTIIMGPGLVMLSLIACYYFMKKVKQSLVNGKAIGKALLAGAITFAYGCYSLIYVMQYLFNVDDKLNIMLIYYVITTISSVFMGAGMYFEGKRLRKREELLVTRRELVQFFADDKQFVKNIRIPNYGLRMERN